MKHCLMIFSKITNEYAEDNTAIQDIVYKVFGITVCCIKIITTNTSMVNSLTVRKINKKVKGFEV